MDKMFTVKNLKKEDLINVAQEIGLHLSTTLTIKEIKEQIIESDDYKNDPEFLAQFIITTVDDRKIREEHERQIELLRAQKQTTISESVQQSEENKIGNLIKTIKTLTISCPEKPELWYLFFTTLERAFETKNVRDDLKAEILLNLLGERAANILIYIEGDEIKNYETIKSLVLREFEPTAQNCLENFNKAKRQLGETHMQFASRLKTTLDYYLRLRECNDFKTLCELIVSDKIFSTIDQETQTHIGIRQGEGWFKPIELAKECDIFFGSKGKSIHRQNINEGNVHRKFSDNDNFSKEGRYILPHLRNVKPEYNKKLKNRCFSCGSFSHLQRDCNKKGYNGKSESKIKNMEALTARVENRHFDSKIHIQPLEYVSIYIDGNEIQAIKDSGTQIAIVNPSFLPNLKVEGQGKIILTSAFGENTEAQLCRLQFNVKPKNKGNLIHEPVEILAAVTEKLNVACLLPPTILDEILETRGDEFIRDAEAANSNEEVVRIFAVETGGGTPREKGSESDILNGSVDLSEGLKEVHSCEETLSEKTDVSKMKTEQLTCETLRDVRKELKLKKGNFCLIEGLIYHKDKILGEAVMQLVLPFNRRNKVLRLAHESVFGSHMGLRKTKERIKYNFFWPGMSQDIANFCKSCEACQLRQVNKISDRAPITAVARPSLPFEVVNIDIIGKLEPPSGRGHHFVLTLIDQHTRWPEAIPLRSISAKATCNALLEIFSRMGIPNIIASDCGANFTAGLTEEFVKRIGSAPRFSVPGYPASNGLIERFNKVVKNMLHHVIREDPSNWDKQLPFLLWAYREVPNCTTGISPFRLMYGREAKGPLAILKSTWAGEVHLPINITETAVDYLQKLKMNLEIAAEKASLVSAEKQKSYVDYFNKRSSCRNFKVGDQVVLLIPDSSNKLYARWTGPGKVVEQCSQHSYKVKLIDGSVRHVHVNKMKKFHARTQAVGVIFEDDHEFGEIIPTPVRNNVLLNDIADLNLEHLDVQKKQDIVKLLGKHQDMFSGKMKIAKVGTHKIRLVEGAIRKKPFVYRIPETLKAKVDEQINELLALDLIEPSDAEIAYPIVCVNKKDGSIRLCIDFRALNEVTLKDDFPMENVHDLINTIGQGNIITSLDILKGYWEIPLEESSRDLTSFKTHRATYRWKVMAFGLKNSSATFQKTMNLALNEHREYCKSYIDDIAIYSNDWKTHLKHLDAVLSKLNDLNFSVNLRKCSFAKRNIKYLGHVIGSGKHEPDPEKIKAIEKLSSPKTKTQLQSVIGLCNYYRDYVQHFATVIYPLTELTKKGVPENLPWTEVHEKAFLTLKVALCNAPKLYTPVLTKPYTIQADASAFGVGSCLSQRNEDDLHPISFASKKLNKTQQSWATIEREAFAVVWSLRKFETWIFGSKIELITDHDPLVYITKGAPQSAKLQRWALALQRYDLGASHCAGKKLTNADALSRLPVDDETN